MEEKISRQARRAAERGKNKKFGFIPNEKPISRRTRRFSKKVNKFMNKIVNEWFIKRSKMEDPDSQESIDLLNHYNSIWMNFCYKNLSKPADFLNEFLNICDKEDKRIRSQVAERESFDTFVKNWEGKRKAFEADGMKSEDIAKEFDKYAKECNIHFGPEGTEPTKAL